MSKLILLLSIFGTTVLLTFGIINPESPVMWLASTSLEFAILRALMIGVLLALFFTHPPRNIYMRMGIGIFATVLASWSLSATYQNSMAFLDSLSLLQFSICTGLIVLERNYTEDKQALNKVVRKKVYRARRASALV